MPDATTVRVSQAGGSRSEEPPEPGPARPSVLLVAPAGIETPALDALARAVTRAESWDVLLAEAPGAHDVALAALPLGDVRERLPRDPAVIALTDAPDEEAAWLRAGACEVASMHVLRDSAALALVLARAAARHEASAARGWAEERYRIMVEHTFDIVAVLDGFGNYLYASPSIEEKMGYSPAELIGTNAFETVHPDDLEMVSGVFFEAVMQPGTTRQLVYRSLAKDGATVYLEGVGRAIVGPDGQPYGVINSRDVTARKRTEEALAASEARFRALAETTADAVVVADAAGLIIDWNRGAEEVFGYTREEAVGQTIETLMPARRVDAHRDGLARQLATGEAFVIGRTVELEGRRASGETFPIDLSLTTWDRDGERFYAAIIRDVTERRAAEAALRAGEARYRSLLDAMPDAIARVEADGLIRDFHVPPGFGSDVHPEDVVGKRVADVLPPPMVELYDEAVRRLREANTPFTYRYETTVHGEPHHREVRGVAGAHGEVVAIFRDVTAEVEAADRLRQQEDLLRQIVTTVPVIVFAFGPDGRLTLAEGRGLERLGVTPAMLRGHDVREAYAAFPDVRRAAERALAGEPYHAVVEVLGRHFDAHLAPVTDPVGRVSRVIGVAADVTDLREQSQALEARTAELALRTEEVERSRADLRALAAHSEEVREAERARLSREVHDVLGQLLTGIRLGTSWLSRRLAGDAEAGARADDTLALVDESIRFAREVAGDLRPGVLDDLGLASALEWQAARFAARTGAACEVEATGPEEGLPAEAATAAFRIAQEALTNAARHAAARAVAVRLEVALSEAGAPGRLRLCVEDDGRGFDPAAPGRPRSLGLLGMHERARILGGELDVDTAPGAGTRVTLTLPLDGPHEAAAAPPAP